jgi:hypothetical protein
MAVNFTGVFNADFKGLLARDEYVAYVHLSDAELSLGALAFATQV